MSVPRVIPAAEAVVLLGRGALLVDIRETAERQAGVIPGAVHAPLSALGHTELCAKPQQPIIFHCRSGRRTALNGTLLQAKAAPGKAFLLDGGIEAWEAAALPLARP